MLFTFSFSHCFIKFGENVILIQIKFVTLLADSMVWRVYGRFEIVLTNSDRIYLVIFGKILKIKTSRVDHGLIG